MPDELIDFCHPGQSADSKATIMQVRAAVERLSHDHRIVIELTEAGLSKKEIAKKLGEPAGTIRSRLFYARRELQGLITSLTTKKPNPQFD